MNTTLSRTYRENRARFSPDELRRRDGQWVAFSPDGLRIVASAADLPELAESLRAAGESLADVVLERIEREDRDVSLGAAELS